MKTLSLESIAYLNSLASIIENHDHANDYEQALAELIIFIEYLSPRGFDMLRYQRLLENEVNQNGW